MDDGKAPPEKKPRSGIGASTSAFHPDEHLSTSDVSQKRCFRRLDVPVGEPGWFLHRELGNFGSVSAVGLSRRLNQSRCQRLAQKLYLGLGKKSKDLESGYEIWDPELSAGGSSAHGGIFGMDFSPDGSILAAACEHRSILFFDPLRRKLINTLERAHEDCANSVKFLDGRLLASCSDDHTVRLWDVRYLRSPIRILRSHSNWVKNVELLRSQGLLLSSAFDGFVYAWDINDPHSEPKRMFYTPGLMRMRVTPDDSKMVLSTQWGYLLIVHDLDMQHLPSDLFGFKPNMYWLMIKTGTMFPTSSDFMHRFRAERNRTELVLDFPEGCDPENISSITPHPQSWCFASRSNNHDEQSEWTCIHDLQLPALEGEYEEERQEPSADRSVADAADLIPSDSHQNQVQVETRPAISTEIRRQRRGPENIITLQMENSGSSSDEEDTGRSNARQVSTALGANIPDFLVRRRRLRAVRRSRGVGVQVNVRSPQLNANISFNSGNWRRDPRAFFIRTGPPHSGNRTIVVVGGSNFSELPGSSTGSHQVPPTYSRLLFYQEEPRMGRGFIKEQSWSPEGRVLASPFGFGVRLLGFGSDCPELSDVCHPQQLQPARAMTEVGTIVKGHESVVLCTRFSPTHCLLATGCLKGRVGFAHPVL